MSSQGLDNTTSSNHGSRTEPARRAGKRALLSAAEERDLARRAQQGDLRARDRMLEANAALVISIARRFGNPYLDADDLVQEGLLGLAVAVERFDPERGIRFSTYASHWIRQRILHVLERHGRMIAMPVDVSRAARRSRRVRRELAETLGRQPTPGEVADACGISEERFRAVMDVSEEPVSLDALMAPESGSPTAQLPDRGAASPEAAVLAAEEHTQLMKLLGMLPPRDRMVLEYRYGLRGEILTFAELAAGLEMTGEGVRQIQHRALARLRRHAAQEQLHLR